MYFMYVDESGDPGSLDPTKAAHLQPSRHYILSGFIIPETEWHNYLMALVDIKRIIKRQYGLAIRDELHGAEIIKPRNNPIYRALGNTKTRVELYREVLQQVVARLTVAKIINIHLDKANPRYHSTKTASDLEEIMWGRLIQRYDTYLEKSCNKEQGLIFADETNEVKIRRILRKMRMFNQVPSKYGGSLPRPVKHIVEDPVMRNSKDSFFIQIADLTAYALYGYIYPKGSLKKYNVDKLFNIFAPLLLTEASSNDPNKMGIVHL